MDELPTIIVVFAFGIALVDQLRRLFAAISLNRTIREALRHSPESVPLLLTNLETRSRLPLATGGWTLLGIGIFLGVFSWLLDDAGRTSSLAAAGVVTAFGLILLLVSWWLTREPRSVPEGK